MSKAEIIKEISAQSNRYGDKLVDMMDSYHVQSLREITEAQAKDYFERKCTAHV